MKTTLEILSLAATSAFHQMYVQHSTNIAHVHDFNWVNAAKSRVNIGRSSASSSTDLFTIKRLFGSLMLLSLCGKINFFPCSPPKCCIRWNYEVFHLWLHITWTIRRRSRFVWNECVIWCTHNIYHVTKIRCNNGVMTWEHFCGVASNVATCHFTISIWHDWILYNSFSLMETVVRTLLDTNCIPNDCHRKTCMISIFHWCEIISMIRRKLLFSQFNWSKWKKIVVKQILQSKVCEWL